MSWYSNYINNIAQPNKEFYEEYAQEVINAEFDDTTLVRTIQEEKYPFNEEYEEYEVQVDSVAEITVNIIKVIGDFITVLFKDCSHKNLRGQKYILDNETYLCYDKISDLAKVARTRLIRCNNEIKWLDEDANIITEKVFLGYELSSTNDAVGKKGITSNRRLVLYVQSNERTKTIKINQRFMFQHNQCFRVEEVDNYNMESGTDGDVTLMRLNIVFSPLQPNDNVELNICDYYDKDFRVEINQKEINQVNGFVGNLIATLKNKDDIITTEELCWKSTNERVVTIDEYGNYKIVGSIGATAKIICYMKDNEDIYDESVINVVDDYLPYKKIVVSPIIDSLNEKDSVEFVCGVYIEGEKVSNDVVCVPSNANKSNYDLTETIDGYKLTNNKLSTKDLVLTFSAEDCDDFVMNVSLDGLL